MYERRFEPRHRATEHVQVRWQDPAGKTVDLDGEVAEISQSGARLHLAKPIRVLTRVQVDRGEAHLKGKVRYCLPQNGRYSVGVEFDVH